MCLVYFIADTSRPPRNGEIDGKDYHFISQSAFQSDINSHKFVEYGQFEGEYYGTSIDSIKAVTNSKACVLNLHCQVCKYELFGCGIHGEILNAPGISPNTPHRGCTTLTWCTMFTKFCYFCRHCPS